jgi:hypothetical protein
VPQRPNQPKDKQTAPNAKKERSVSNDGLVVDKGESPPAEEAIAVTVAEGTKPRQRRKKTKKSKAEKSEVCAFQEEKASTPLIGESLQEEKASTPSDWGKSNPSASDWGISTSSTCDSTKDTLVHNPGASAHATERPTRGVMKDYYDDRADREWGE